MFKNISHRGGNLTGGYHLHMYNRSVYPRSSMVIVFTFYQIIMSFMAITTNLLTFTIMRRPHFKKLPTSFFLAVLAVTDSALCFPRLVPIINNALKMDIRTTSSYACEFFYVAYRGTLDSSNLIVVVISIERFLTVFFPHKKKLLLTYNRARILSALVIFYAYFVPLVFFFGIGRGKSHIIYMQSKPICIAVPNPKKSIRMIMMYWMTGTGLPTLCIFICTVATISRLFILKRKTALSDGTSQSISYINKMLLGVCAMFIITNGALAIYWIIGSRIYSPSYLESWNNNIYLGIGMLYTVS